MPGTSLAPRDSESPLPPFPEISNLYSAGSDLLASRLFLALSPPSLLRAPPPSLVAARQARRFSISRPSTIRAAPPFLFSEDYSFSGDRSPPSSRSRITSGRPSTIRLPFSSPSRSTRPPSSFLFEHDLLSHSRRIPSERSPFRWPGEDRPPRVPATRTSFFCRPRDLGSFFFFFFSVVLVYCSPSGRVCASPFDYPFSCFLRP